MKVTLEYKTHHYFEEYDYQLDIFCPSCGTKNVWMSKEGDYYVGETYLCTNCNSDFNMPLLKEANETYKHVIDQIKSGKQSKPISPKGK